ncbi:hypothetical protein SAMN05660649_04237 [Desulfotomaculum arcticum]|uniref:Uncharacterized protein n=1 Tax=Desulfotruncus arcticus DSM 17038 TaxID=1121424 RepID=A0A1I2Y8E9_9FIRM|nr:zinc ribbon domain-containing protein [Desulfotruncus arcticus]SFH20671.1 hypothetical protein SAMN05660649_04237 [Desulfotomaculum arcticum] [Desulfotruncus arcticus DSM 17038]
MTLQEAQSFIKAVLAQQEINREVHGSNKEDDERKPIEWGVIAGEHMGHLLGALRSGNQQLIENEILHVAGPLLECWNAIKTSVKQVSEYKCTSCGEVFSLDESNNKCPLCESKLEKVKVPHISEFIQK